MRDTPQKIKGVFVQYPVLENNGVCVVEIDGLIFLPDKTIVVEFKSKVDVNAINQVRNTCTIVSKHFQVQVVEGFVGEPCFPEEVKKIALKKS